MLSCLRIKGNLKIEVMKLKAFVFRVLLFSLVLVVGCESEGNVDLDNSGDEVLEVVVDGQKYVMPKNSYRKIQLEKGMHTLIMKDAEGKVLEETRFMVSNGGLLNLSKSNYFIWKDLYGDASVREEKLSEEWIKIDKEEFFGDFTTLPTETIYTEKRWDYGLSEDFPSDLLGWEIDLRKNRYIIKSKLFRQNDLIQAYKSIARTEE